MADSHLPVTSYRPPPWRTTAATRSRTAPRRTTTGTATSRDQPPSGNADGTDLAETGGSDTTPYIAAGGAAVVLLGGGLMIAARKRRENR
ncbi:LAETG motif-containing sortase-dependent surface protein [Streptomyces sp. CL7]|uniref:LAETG motif-containing sortase-dependent surface protein n=1 Tax=Streptomyces sp. CL7 TaxID=3096006 RepID=UPI0039BE9D31